MTRSTPAADSDVLAGSPASAADFAPLYLGSFIAYGDRYLIGPLLVLIAADYGVTLGAAAAVATVYLLLYGGLQFLYGLGADRFGRVRVMRAALAGVAVANVAAALAPSLDLLVVARGVAAAFAAGLVPTSFVYIGDKVPFEARQRVIANVLAAGSIGTVVAIVGAGVLGRYASWRLVFLLPAALATVDAALLARLPESLAARRPGGPLGQVRRVLARPWALFLIALALAEGAAMLTFITFLAPTLQIQGVSSAEAGLVVAAYGVAVFVALQGLKRLLAAERITPVVAIAGGGAILIGAYAMAASSQTVAAILATSVLIGIGYSFMHSSLQTWATEVVPEARGTAVSLFVTAVFTGASIAHAAVSPLASDHRFRALFGVGIALAVPVTVAAALGRVRFSATRADVVTAPVVAVPELRPADG